VDSRILIGVLLFAIVGVIVMLVAWWYARRVKRDLDAAPASFASARGVVDIAPASIQKLLQLSAEPILLKQTPEGVRVQVDQRPMLPLMAFAGQQATGALAETAAAVTERYGMRWVVLVSATDDGRLSVQRLA
jgi:hypothetical protein